jgi:excisionase family DNA binding protein
MQLQASEAVKIGTVVENDLGAESEGTASLTSTLPPAMTRQQVAAELQVSIKTIERLINRGELNAVKVYSQWRIMRADFEAFVQRLRNEQQRRIGRVSNGEIDKCEN